MIRALVTGGAGMIGSHLVDLLLASGYSVRIFDNLHPSVHKERPAWIPKDSEFIQGDMSDTDALSRALQNIDVIFHQAAYGGCVPDIGMIEVNVLGTARMFELIRSERIPIQKIVTASSQAIYGEGSYTCYECGPCHPKPRTLEQMKRHEWELRCPLCSREMTPFPTDESVHPEITGIYPLSKYCEEVMTLNFGQTTGIATAALRYTLTYGPRQSVSNPYTGICSIFATRLLNDLPPVIYEDGRQTRDFVFVGDVARANLIVMESDAANGHVFNVGTGIPTSIGDFAETLSEVLGKEIEPSFPGTFRPMDYRHLVANVSALKSLGWKPQISLRDGIECYADWIKSLPKPRDEFGAAENILRNRNVVFS